MISHSELLEIRDGLKAAGSRARKEARNAVNSERTKDRNKVAARRFELALKVQNIADSMPYESELIIKVNKR